MIYNIGRYIIIGLGILCLSIYIPQFYWRCFSSTTNIPYFIYSSKDKEICMIKKIDDRKIMLNTKGDEYSRDELENKCPLFFNRQLVFSGTMPDSIHGIAIRKNMIEKNQFYYWWEPADLNKAKIDLYPLLESKSGRVKLQMPKDFFTINESIEFINCDNNKINKEKSALFTNTLIEKGFSFPAKDIFGNISIEKPFDEAYFIIDNNGDLFHMKMIEARVYCHKFDYPKNIKAKKIIVKESDLKEFMAFMIDTNNNVYLISYDKYMLIKLPIKTYNSEIDKFAISGNVFNRMITISNNTDINFYVLDRDYNLVDFYSEEIIHGDNIAIDISKYYIPFSTYYRTSKDETISLRFTDFSWLMFIGNLSFVLVFLIYLLIFKYKIKYSLPDIILISLFGIYGFICVLVFPKLKNKRNMV